MKETTQSHSNVSFSFVLSYRLVLKSSARLDKELQSLKAGGVVARTLTLGIQHRFRLFIPVILGLFN